MRNMVPYNSTSLALKHISHSLWLWLNTISRYYCLVENEYDLLCTKYNQFLLAKLKGYWETSQNQTYMINILKKYWKKISHTSQAKWCVSFSTRQWLVQIVFFSLLRDNHSFSHSMSWQLNYIVVIMMHITELWSGWDL